MFQIFIIILFRISSKIVSLCSLLYAQNLLIILIILKFTAEFYNLFTSTIKLKLQQYFVAYIYYWVKL